MISLQQMRLFARTTPMRRFRKTTWQSISTQHKQKSNAWRRKREKLNSSSFKKRRGRKLMKISKSFRKRRSRDLNL